MNEKILGWIAIAVFIFAAGWVHKYKIFTGRQLQAVIITILLVGIFCRVVAIRCARWTVLNRRRMYKEFWRRCDVDPMKEEDLIILLGRIKGGRLTAALMIVATIIALIFNKNIFALLLSLGQAFLAAKLYLIARKLNRIFPADDDRDLPDIPIPPTTSDSYLVKIDLHKVHNFIRPVEALPFWDLLETEKWLQKCGLIRLEGGLWKTSKQGLRFLDSDEIVSIKPNDEY